MEKTQKSLQHTRAKKRQKSEISNHGIEPETVFHSHLSVINALEVTSEYKQHLCGELCQYIETTPLTTEMTDTCLMSFHGVTHEH